jgi:general secretion pathway protein J
MTRPAVRLPTSGMTLVEVLVALAVFAVIGTAAFAMLDQTLRSERLAGARLARLVEVQRTMRILSIDTLQAISGSVTQDGASLSFLRRGAVSQGGGPAVDGLVVRYALEGDTFIREIGAPGMEPARQPLLTDVLSAQWQLVQSGAYLSAGSGTEGTEGLDLVLDLSGDQRLRGLFPVPHDLTKPPPP